MGVFDDYINGLEGKENIDPLEVAHDLAKLHNDEIEPFQVKITTQEAVIAERDQAIIDSQNEIDKYKLRNYDLAMQIPGNPLGGKDDSENDEITGETITPNDLFGR